MSGFRVKTAAFSQAMDDLSAIQKTLGTKRSELTTLNRSIQGAIGTKAGIRNRLTQIANELTEEGNKAQGLSGALGQIIQQYQLTEQTLSEGSQNKIDIRENAGTGGGGGGMRGRGDSTQDWSQENNAAGGTTKETDPDNQLLEVIKSLLKWADKTKSSDSAGLGNDGLSYLQSLYQFFTGDKKGLTGAEDWFDLGDKSIGLWTGFYEYLKNFYHDSGSAFSTVNQKNVAGLGILGGIFGLISSAFGAADAIHNGENMGPAGVIGEILGLGGDAADIWGGVYKLKHLGEAASSGLYSPVMFYTTIAKSYFEAFAQGFKSYGKYAADGSWTLDDTGRTGVEFAVSGLYSMVQSMTFGLISEGTTGVSADEVSTHLENWAAGIGTRAGDYILSDPALHEAFNNSGPIGGVAITFYAAVRSLWN